MKILIGFIMFLFLLVSVEPAFSHSGRTDSSGCHTNHQTGDYHCHSGGGGGDGGGNGGGRNEGEDDDDNGCAIAGPEDTHEDIVLNLLLIGLSLFSPPDS